MALSKNTMPSCWQDPKWYAVFVRSNQERKVSDGLAGRGVENYLPSYSSNRQWKDRRVILDVPLFPGYVFVRVPLLERMNVLTVPGVLSLVGNGQAPSEVPEEEIHRIKRGIGHGTAKPYPYLNEGDRVVITSGIMSGIEGILLRRQHGANVVIAIESIFRAFLVEVDEGSVQPVAHRVRSQFQAHRTS